MRPSHLRLADLGKLVLLRYPVRCYSCLERNFVSLPAAIKLHFDFKAQRQRKSSSKDSTTRRRVH